MHPARSDTIEQMTTVNDSKGSDGTGSTHNEVPFKVVADFDPRGDQPE